MPNEEEGADVRVRMKVAITGLRDGRRWPARGEDAVVPDAEGAALCANGYAEPVADIKPERAEPARAERRARKSDEG